MDATLGRKPAVAIYAWKIEVAGHQPIARVTGIDEMHTVMRVLDLPGLRYPQDITADTDGIVPDTGMFQHIDAEDGFDWLVWWMKVSNT